MSAAPSQLFKTTATQRQKAKKYYWLHRKTLSAYYKSLPDDVRERRRERTRRWRAVNKERKAQYDKRWRENNPDKWRLLSAKQRQKPESKIVSNLRHRLREFVRQATARLSIHFGCTPTQLRAHLEVQFTRGMSWSTYGAWHIDHIVPCSAFDLTNPEQVRLCFNWQNLRPVWAKDNLAKGKRIVQPQLSLPLDISPSPPAFLV